MSGSAYKLEDGTVKERPEYDAECFEQITTEHVEEEKKPDGTVKRLWMKRRERNEARDCRVLQW